MPPPLRLAGPLVAPTRAAIAESTAALIGALVGPYLLAFDVRSLRHVETTGSSSSVDDIPAIAAGYDLRRLFGTPRDEVGQTLLCTLRGGRTTRVVVDAGLRLLRVQLERVYPVPEVLRRIDAMKVVGAIFETDEDLIGWLIDPARLPAGDDA